MGLNQGSQELIFIEVTGLSMWPFLKSGEKLIIKKTSMGDLRLGDIILYRTDNQLVSHRLVKRVRNEDGYLVYTRGDNSNSLPKLVTEQMFLGKAIGIIKHSKTISLIGRRRRFVNRIIVIIAPLVSMGIKTGKALLRKQ